MEIIRTVSAIVDVFAEQAVGYFLFTVPAFLVFWVIGKRYFAQRRIQPVRRATHRQLRREVANSLLFVVSFAVVDTFLLKSSEAGGANLYTDVDQHGGIFYVLLSCFVLFVIDDTYFYWSHRLMHHPRLYQAVHKVHHQSIDTSPFTAYSFHPLEGLLEMGSLVFVGLYAHWLPVHLGALIAWQVGAILLNVVGHLGYEVYPAKWNRYWFLKWKVPSTHHNMHHERFNGNYALYFNWWDRLMGTEFKDYESRYERTFNRGKTGESGRL